MREVRLTKHEKRFMGMIACISVAILMIYLLYLTQYPEGNSLRNLCNATSQSLIIIMLMIFPKELISAYAVLLLAGVVSVIGSEKTNGYVLIFFSLVGILIYIIRYIYGRNYGYIRYGKNIKERFMNFLNDKLKVIELSGVYKLILTFIMLSVIINNQRSILEGANISTIYNGTTISALQISAVTNIPIFTFMILALNLKDGMYLKVIESAIFIMALTQIYIANPDKTYYAFEIFEMLIMMFIPVYSIMYNTTLEDKEGYLYE